MWYTYICLDSIHNLIHHIMMMFIHGIHMYMYKLLYQSNMHVVLFVLLWKTLWILWEMVFQNHLHRHPFFLSPEPSTSYMCCWLHVYSEESEGKRHKREGERDTERGGGRGDTKRRKTRERRNSAPNYIHVHTLQCRMHMYIHTLYMWTGLTLKIMHQALFMYMYIYPVSFCWLFPLHSSYTDSNVIYI